MFPIETFHVCLLLENKQPHQSEVPYLLLTSQSSKELIFHCLSPCGAGAVTGSHTVSKTSPKTEHVILAHKHSLVRPMLSVQPGEVQVQKQLPANRVFHLRLLQMPQQQQNEQMETCVNRFEKLVSAPERELCTAPAHKGLGRRMWAAGQVPEALLAPELRWWLLEEVQAGAWEAGTVLSFPLL